MKPYGVNVWGRTFAQWCERVSADLVALECGFSLGDVEHCFDLRVWWLQDAEAEHIMDDVFDRERLDQEEDERRDSCNP